MTPLFCVKVVIRSRKLNDRQWPGGKDKQWSLKHHQGDFHYLKFQLEFHSLYYFPFMNLLRVV